MSMLLSRCAAWQIKNKIKVIVIFNASNLPILIQIYLPIIFHNNACFFYKRPMQFRRYIIVTRQPFASQHHSPKASEMSIKFPLSARFIKAFLCRRGMTLTEASSGFENCPVKYHNGSCCQSHCKEMPQNSPTKDELGLPPFSFPHLTLHCQIYLWRLLFEMKCMLHERSVFGRSIKSLYKVGRKRVLWDCCEMSEKIIHKKICRWILFLF